MSSGQQKEAQRKERCPWPSDSPLSRFILQHGSDLPPLQRLIASHSFNHQAELLVPAPIERWSDRNPIQSLASHFFYAVRTVISHLLTTEFLNTYIRAPTKQFYALLHQAPADQTSTVAIYPPGKMVLTVDGDLYSQLGLTGTKLAFQPVKGSRKQVNMFQQMYQIQIDMTKSDFAPGNALYDRVIWCLSERLGTVQLILSCYHENKPQTIDFPPTVTNVQCLKIRTAQNTRDNVPLPQVDGNSGIPFQCQGAINSSLTGSETEAEAAAYEFFLWQSFIACDIPEMVQPSSDSMQAIMSQFQSGLTMKNDTLSSIRFDGFLAPCIIQQCFQTAHELVQSNVVEWAAIRVNGFIDAPVSFGDCSHSVLLQHGENDFSIVILPSSRYWLGVSVGPHDQYS